MYKVGSIEVALTGVNPPEKDPTYRGFVPGQTILKRGHHEPERAAFPVDTVWDRDVEIPLRDGCVLRADVFRPATSSDNVDGRVPALVAWSPYGKTGQGTLSVGIFPGRVGVAKDRTSGYESFEAPDPAEWVGRGYAVCNVNSRGAFDSEGDIRWWGSAEGRDGYDTIEHLGKQDWCNGSVAMVGNSWLAISQYYVAAEQPSHLKCIAPLEGASDLYRETLCRGGIPNLSFAGAVAAGMHGRSKQESPGSMLMKYPLWNEYWEDKRAKLDRIQVPSYILGSFSTGLHTEGAFRAFEEISGPKWLRIHPYQEWYDLYLQETNDDLQKFLDKYTKNVNNDWESTPKLRLSIQRYNAPAIANQAFGSWPLPQTKYTTFYLDASGTLVSSKPNTPSSIEYQSDVQTEQRDADDGELRFEYTFDKRTCFAGHAKAILYMSTQDADDMAVFIQLRKSDQNGKLLQSLNVPLEALKMQENQVPDMNIYKYLGPTGMIQASHRELDESLSKPYKPVLSHKAVQRVGPGEVVELEVAIWPGAIMFEPGEKLTMKISGHEMRFPEFEVLRGKFNAGNKGKHRVYCGTDGFFSELTVPFVDL